MTDLPHTYDSDITYSETQDKIAVTEFTAQKMGQDINYLIDTYPPLVATIASLAAAIAKIADVNTSWSGASTSGTPLFSTPSGAPMKGALLFVPTSFSGGGPGLLDAQGPVSIVVVPSSANQNWFYNAGGGVFKFFITGDTCFIACFGSTGGLSITGIQIF